MAIQAITNHLVSPTENDVNGGTTGAGIVFGVESTMADLLRFPVGLSGFVISGFTPPATLTGSLTHAIAAGVARIDGYTIKGTLTTSTTFTAGVTEYWWLQLISSGSKVVSLQLVGNSGETAYPNNAIPLWKVVASGTQLTTVTDRRPGGRRLYGSVTLSGAINEHGSGLWSVSKGALGAYTLTFASGVFIRTPIVMTTPNSTSSIVSSAPSSSTSCAISVTSGGSAADLAWSFEAMI